MSRYGIHFTGPIKMGSGGFPINDMHWQSSLTSRSEHIVLKLAGKDIWAVGWHDHHYRCYITTHGMTLPPLYLVITPRLNCETQRSLLERACAMCLRIGAQALTNNERCFLLFLP